MQLCIANPYFNGLTIGIYVRNARALIHGCSMHIVVPGEPVFSRKLFFGYPHHLRLACACSWFAPDHTQSCNDAIVGIDTVAGGTNDADWTIIHVIIFPYTGSAAE